MSKQGKVLRFYDTRVVFENLETGNCLLISQIKEAGSRARDLQVCDRSQLPDLGGSSQVMPLEAIFGIYDLLSGAYAAIVVESENYVSVNNINMRKAKKTLIVPLFRTGRVLSETKQRDEDRYLQLLHRAFSETNFFFSQTYDVTLTQQKLAQLSQRDFSEPIWTRADHRFFWNREVIIDLIACEADQWIVPFMSAYVEVRPECEIPGQKFTLLFVSRRSRYRQGCRFTKRGVDEHGFPANFVETEQILLFPDGKVTSFVQIRGSIPLHWASPVLMKYDPNVYIEDDRSKSEESAVKHFTDVTDRYADLTGKSGVICVNLIDKKKDQGKLGAAYEELMSTIQPRIPHPLRYVWFDFHHETKQKGKWKNLSKLIAQIDEHFKAQRYFSRLPNGTVSSWQVGVIRTNCMDNLDRTNVVQSLFARRSLITQLGQTDLLSSDNPMDTPFKSFEKVYKTVWAHNADAISLGYAGTGALKVDFTKTGKRTFKGMFNDGVNSMMRYYINNFTDGIKQDSIDLLLGYYRPDPASPSPFAPRPGKESLADNLTKAFVFMIMVFSTLLLFTPRLTGNTDVSLVTADATTLTSSLVISAAVTMGVGMFMMHKVMKKGSRVGERIVVHPLLMPEPIRLLPSKKLKARE
jgi:hypothetical protein